MNLGLIIAWPNNKHLWTHQALLDRKAHGVVYTRIGPKNEQEADKSSHPFPFPHTASDGTTVFTSALLFPSMTWILQAALHLTSVYMSWCVHVHFLPVNVCRCAGEVSKGRFNKRKAEQSIKTDLM